MTVRHALLDLVAFAEPRQHTLFSLVLREPCKLARLVVHSSVGADHGQLGQVVVEADLVVGGVVGRSDLQRSRAEVALDALVCDHRDGSLDPRDDDLAADRVPIALVIGMDCNCDVPEDRRGTNRGDRDVTVTVRERVADIRQRVVDVLVCELEIRERREVVRAPVPDPVRTVDPALVPQVHEEPHDRADVCVVHGEPLAPVVERCADAAELQHDLAAVLAQPLPDAGLERLPTEVVARLSFQREVLLDGVLGGDPGVVVARLEEDVESLHPPHADDRVRERQLQRMPEVQVAGHVGRRVRDRERAARGIRIGVVEALGLPRLLPALLDALRLVSGQHLAHGRPMLRV